MVQVARLAIDYGTTYTRAVLVWPSGDWQVLAVDGQQAMPSSVYATADGIVTGAAAWDAAMRDASGWVPHPRDHLREDKLVIGGREVTGVQLSAAVLGRVRQQAQAIVGAPPDEVVLVVPATWGPQRLSKLRQAAHQAGLPAPALVEVPVAVARYLISTGLTIPVGGWIGVCDLGAEVEASVVQRVPGGTLEVASRLVADAGGRRLDEILESRVLAVLDTTTGATGFTDAERLEVASAVRAGREALSGLPSVAIALPGDRPAVVLQAQQVQQWSEPVLEQIAVTVREAIDAAQVPTEPCVGLFAVGGLARWPAVTPHLGVSLVRQPVPTAPAPVAEEAVPPAVQVVAEPHLAAVWGAAGTSAAPAVAQPVESGGVLVRTSVQHVVVMLLTAVSAIALWWNFHSVSYVEANRIDARLNYLMAPWGELALFGLTMLLFFLSLATLLAAALPAPMPSPKRPTEASRQGRRMGAGLLAALALGAAITTLMAMIPALFDGLPAGEYLRWALLPCIPTALAVGGAVVQAWAMHRVPIGGWDRWLLFPTISLLPAVLGMLAAAEGLFPAPTGGIPGAALLSHTGGALIGAGIGLAFTRRLRTRLLVAIPIAVLCAILIGQPTLGLLAVAYALACAAWWGLRVWQLASATPPSAAMPDQERFPSPAPG